VPSHTTGNTGPKLTTLLARWGFSAVVAPNGDADHALRVAEAQVHAMLALAAATALAQSADGEAQSAWQHAAGEQPTPTAKDPREQLEEWSGQAIGR
jgi:hypothetical protein